MILDQIIQRNQETQLYYNNHKLEKHNLYARKFTPHHINL